MGFLKSLDAQDHAAVLDHQLIADNHKPGQHHAKQNHRPSRDTHAIRPCGALRARVEKLYQKMRQARPQRKPQQTLTRGAAYGAWQNTG